ncbi:MAG: 50S ribosomal protein L9 [Acidimicrobiia bacterium]|nr:50S ribosomal protein L9 [Acidimicrobiia bacterium]
MRVVLHETISGLGNRGDIVEVSDGFARNLLIPKGQAQQATAGVEAQAATMKKSWQARNAKEREAAEEIAKVLVAKTVEISARAGAEGKLFGSVTSGDVVEAIQVQSGVELDRKMVELEEPIRSVGMHAVTVKPHSDVQFPVSISVVAA